MPTSASRPTDVRLREGDPGGDSISNGGTEYMRVSMVTTGNAACTASAAQLAT